LDANGFRYQRLRRWIAEGAPFENHWSFVKPARAALPAVKNPMWVKNPVDAFILAKLDSLGLTPAPEAERRALIRRVSLDLTGLPPTPEEVEAFVNDPAGNAYEKLVDRLLASPRYGERSARLWLDLVHYADSDKRADRFVSMYVNHWTVDYGERGRQAVQLLLDRAHAAGLIPERVQAEFVSP